MLEVRISGIEGAIASLEEVNLDRLDMGEIASFMEAEHRRYFAEEAGPDGPWAGLAPSTLSQKRSGAILRETSVMAGSVASHASDLEAGVSVGQDYAIFHQTGTSKMSQRKIVGFRPDHPAKILRILERQLGG